jgi:hypothetical protein
MLYSIFSIYSLSKKELRERPLAHQKLLESSLALGFEHHIPESTRGIKIYPLHWK